MENFTDYLQSIPLSSSTIKEHLKNLKRFIQWVKEHEFNSIEEVIYTELLNYVQHLKKRNVSPHTLNININSIRKYYDYLKKENKVAFNPAQRLYIKGAIQKIIHHQLTVLELETLYLQYLEHLEEKDRRLHTTSLRNKVIVGLIIHQALHTGELAKLETSHINLVQGTIYIPSTARNKSRTLPLEALQIMPLNDYLKSIPTTQSKLFTAGMNAILNQIIAVLKQINPNITNTQHLRASVILHWLRRYNKREVQHRMGYKSIAAVERYEVQELTDLIDSLQKYHPLK